jgi:hypothetical protein
MHYLGKKMGQTICLFPNVVLNNVSTKIYPLQFMEKMLIRNLDLSNTGVLFGPWMNEKHIIFNQTITNQHDSHIKIPEHGNWTIDIQLCCATCNRDFVNRFCYDNPHIPENRRYQISITYSQLMDDLFEGGLKHLYTNFQFFDDRYLSIQCQSDNELIGLVWMLMMILDNTTLENNLYINAKLLQQLCRCGDGYRTENKEIIDFCKIPIRDCIRLFNCSSKELHDRMVQYCS